MKGVDNKFEIILIFIKENRVDFMLQKRDNPGPPLVFLYKDLNDLNNHLCPNSVNLVKSYGSSCECCMNGVSARTRPSFFKTL